MLKYQKRGLCKALSMLLTLVMILTSQVGITQTYALEDEQPTLTDNGAPLKEGDSAAATSPSAISLLKADTTPPSFVEGKYPKSNPQQAGSRQIYIYGTAEEAVNFRAVLIKDEDTPPTKEQVRDGLDAWDQPAIKTFSNSSPNTNISINGFVPLHSVDYDVYVVLIDGANNLSEPSKVDFPSPPPAELLASGYPKIGDIQPEGSKQVKIKAQIQNVDSGKKGKVYWVLLSDGATAPSIENIATGIDGEGYKAINSGSTEFSMGIEESFLVTGAEGNKQYDFYMVVGNTGWAYPLSHCTDVVKLDVITPADMVGEKVCSIGETEYDTLAEALNAVESGESKTIKLLKSFTTVQGAAINSRHITFDLNGEMLNITTSEEAGLRVLDGTVALEGSGQFNVSGKNYGVFANDSTVTVTNATATDMVISGEARGIGTYAQAYSKVTVLGNASGEAHGVKAEISSEVMVNGDVSNTGQILGAVYSEGRSQILVKGNVLSTRGKGVHANSGKITIDGSVSANRVGAVAEGLDSEIIIKGDLSCYNNGAVISSNSGSITVDGEIKNTGVSYVSILSVYMKKEQGVPDLDKLGYLKYSHSGSNGVVWVKDTAMEVATQEELEAALNSIVSEGNIRLKGNIDYNKGIVIKTKTVNFDLNGFTLNVINSDGDGLHVNSGTVIAKGSGAMNVTGTRYGVLAWRETSRETMVDITNATANKTYGVLANGLNTTVTVRGDVQGITSGVYAVNGGEVCVHGDVLGVDCGIGLLDRGEIIVRGNIEVSGAEGIGAYMDDAFGTIIIDGIMRASNYIKILEIIKLKSEGVEDSAKPGYLKYTGRECQIWIKDEKPTATYVLTVQDGTGSGSFDKDAMVTITANEAPDGQQFKGWVITPNITFEGDTTTTSQTVKFKMPAQAVTATAIYDLIPPAVNSVTVNPSTVTVEKGTTYQFNATVNGTNSPSQSVIWTIEGGVAGTTITTDGLLTVDANERAATINVKATSTVDAGKSGTATVTVMQAAITHIVTFNLNGGTRIGGGELIQSLPDGGSAIAPTVTRNGYTFTGWDKAFTNITQSISINATWNYNGGGGNGGGYSDNSGGSYTPTPTPVPTPVPEKKTDQPVKALVTVTTTAGAKGIASAIIPNKAITDTMAKAQAEAEAQGKMANGIHIIVKLNNPFNTKPLSIVLTQPMLKQLADSKVKQFEVDGQILSLILDQESIGQIKKESTGDVTITIKPVTVKGVHNTYHIDISYIKNGKTVNITNLGNGRATISIPYTPSKNEAIGYLFGVYVDSNGKTTRIPGSSYDANSKSIILSTSYILVYGIGYEATSAKFKDIGSHWAKDSIDYVVCRGLLSGTSNTTFSPNTAVSRGMLLTALGKLEGADVSGYKLINRLYYYFFRLTGEDTKSSIINVEKDKYYLPYILWAYKEGIVSGKGINQLALDRAVTREEMAVILTNYAKATGYKLPVTRKAITFTDNSSISDYAKDAVKAMQQAGIIMGEENNKFNPKANITRAEVAATLHRYIKLTLDPSTAQGWAKNDDGQFMYYKDGSLVVNTKIDGFDVDENGVRKTK